MVYKVQTRDHAWAEHQIMLLAANCRFCVKVLDYKVSFVLRALQTLLLEISLELLDFDQLTGAYCFEMSPCPSKRKSYARPCHWADSSCSNDCTQAEAATVHTLAVATYITLTMLDTVH